MALQPATVFQEDAARLRFATPLTFDSVLGASAVTLYSGKADRYFLIRGVAAVNTTGSAITLGLTVNGNTWYSGSVAANSTARISDVEGMLLDVSLDLAATGNGLRVFGWGVRVFGGDGWAL